jgi:hypothetical protein
VFFVHPLADKFEVFRGLFHANNAYGITGAGGMPAVPSPGFWVAIHIHKVLAGEFTPPLPGAVDKGLFTSELALDFVSFSSEKLGVTNIPKKMAPRIEWFWKFFKIMILQYAIKIATLSESLTNSIESYE